MKKLIPNTLLEGIGYLATGNIVSDFQDVTSTNRGKIVAVDLYMTRDTNPAQMYDVDFTVGGQEIVGLAPSIDFDIIAYPSKYLLIPLRINDGQTFAFKVDNTGADLERLVQAIFIREGAVVNYDRNSLLSTYTLSKKFLSTTSQDIFEGEIPKNRGKCIGFSLITKAFQTDLNTDKTLLTFSVGGVELIRNVTASIFQPVCTRPYQRLFTPLEAGSTFRFEIEQTGVVADRYFSVEFYFEKDK